MTAYLSIGPLQEPFDLGLDESGRRVQFAFNVIALKRSSATFQQEIVGLLVAAGLGVAGSTIIASSAAKVPTTGPYILITATGGTSPVGTHNDGAAAYRRPGAQIIAAAEKSADAAALAEAAFVAVIGVRNRAVSA